MADLLFEIGLEEVPARMIAAAQAELLRRLTSLLARESFLLADDALAAKSYSTPRRLSVLIPNVQPKQPTSHDEVLGPAAKIAFKDGQPTQAATAFAKKNGVTVEQLKRIDTPNGEYVAASTTTIGRTAAEFIATEFPKEIAAIYWAKNMYWRAGKPERFVRPVMWIVCLLGDAVVPVSFGGKTAGRATFGHRVLSSGEPFEIVSTDSYVAQLEGEYVIADVEARRHKIRKALDHVTRELPGARWREDEALVDQVTHLTEWPTVLLGNFEPEYLALPEEVLVTVMRDHQKYFAVEDAAGKLAPHFLTVLNISTDENSAAIIRQGNERVLRARFNDARFFWEFDQRVPLEARVKLLENVTFQKDLGSYAAKSERVRAIAAKLSAMANELAMGRAGKADCRQVDAKAVDEAARLAKTDLTTELVKEFTELQGVIGGLYAKAQGVDATTADAIYDQYLPASGDDAIPRSWEGAILGLADRIDTIYGMFKLGLEPTGSKDPFALRRAANAIVRILAESEIPLLNNQVIDVHFSLEEIRSQDATFVRLHTFFVERIEFYLREIRGNAYDTVAAIRGAGTNYLEDAVARAAAVTATRGSDDFLAVCASFKRMKNILAQASTSEDISILRVDPELLTDPSEKALAATAGIVALEVAELSAQRNYTAALAKIAQLRPVIDEFFDTVMVMAPEAEIRANRLGLLSRTLADFSKIADFSVIVTAG